MGCWMWEFAIYLIATCLEGVTSMKVHRMKVHRDLTIREPRV